MRPLHVSHVRHVRDVDPQAARVSWDALSRRLTRMPPARPDLCPAHASEARLRELKGRLPAWIPARFHPERGRRSDAVRDVHLLVLDYDDGDDPRAESERWSEWAHCVHTTWSHTFEHPKFRLVLPLAAPVGRMRWPRVYAWATQYTGGRIDPQACNVDRLYFLPSICRPGAPWDAWTHHGPWLELDPEDLAPTEDELQRARRRARAMARAQRPDARQRTPQRLREDPTLREAVAHRVGAQICDRPTGRIAAGAMCPQCGRADVWFAVEPRKSSTAKCNHRSSCGWTGPLTDLESR